MNEDLPIGCMPYKQYKDLTFSLSGRKLSWRPYTNLSINKSSPLIELMVKERGASKEPRKICTSTRFDFANVFGDHIPARSVHN